MTTATVTDTILEVKDVSKRFGANLVLQGVSFELRAGEVHALLGENGAGKSTLMKIIAGVYEPDAGEILLRGARTDFRDPGQAVTAGISTVYQELNLIPSLSAASNIMLGREESTALFLHERQMRAAAAAALTEIGSRAKPGTIVETLSTGERQLVEIARALSSESSVIIMDEPTAALSSGEIETLHRSIRQLQSRGISVVYISHKLDEVFRIADRVSILRDGALVRTLDTGETTRDEVVSLMLGRELRKEMAHQADERRFNDADGARLAPVLRVEGLTVPGKIEDVTFEVGPGEILGFAGLVGAGRTETMRAIVGLERIRSGTVQVAGRRLRARSPRAAQNRGVVLIPEDRKTQGLLLDLSVEANIALPHLRSLSSATWVRRRALKTLVQQCIERFDVRPTTPKTSVRLLSGGNQQKVLIGRWLLRSHTVLIFDEPSKGVDVGARAGIWQMIRDVAAQGTAVVVVSSETEELIALADRIVVMKEGRVSAALENRNLSEDEVMQHAF
ncbi:sugar ABC transporter ATP-binding protein [Herbiconiux sp. YIM B11900]|uniref:sugar ABC transporter ATP-binding protein n=1 Tax=Herbiconiux sp. YIM B11900 TaxID=3404131 RepID=UPI003F865650